MRGSAVFAQVATALFRLKGSEAHVHIDESIRIRFSLTPEKLAENIVFSAGSAKHQGRCEGKRSLSSESSTGRDVPRMEDELFFQVIS